MNGYRSATPCAEVQIAGAERPGLMLDIMLSMRAQGIGVVQGVIDATAGGDVVHVSLVHSFLTRYA